MVMYMVVVCHESYITSYLRSMMEGDEKSEIKFVGRGHEAKVTACIGSDHVRSRF